MKTKATMKKIILASLFVGFSLPTIIAQTGEDSDPNLNSEIDIVGIRKNRLKDANKMTTFPELKETALEMPTIQYSLIPNKQEVTLTPAPIAPAKVQVEEKLKKLYRGYVTAGFGNYTTPYAELSYTSGRSRSSSWGLNGKHLSSNGGVTADDSIPSAFSDNHLGIWGEKLIKRVGIRGAVNYDRNVIHNYGFDPEVFTEVNTEKLKKTYQTIAVSGDMRTYNRDSASYNNTGSIQYTYFTNDLNDFEHNFIIKDRVQRYINTELFSADLNLDYNQFNTMNRLDSISAQKDNVILGVTPMATTMHKNWNISLGMGLYVDARGTSTFHFYPIAHAQYSLFQDLFVPYVGVTGKMEQNTYRKFTEVNPFVVASPELKSTNHKLELYGGVRGAISSKVSYTTRLSTKKYADFAYFVNDSLYTAGNEFQVIYDDLSVTNFSGELALSGHDKFSFFLRGDFFLYNTEKEQYAWHQPNVRFTLTGKYNIQDKLIAGLEIYQVGKRKAKSLTPVNGIAPEPDGSTITNLKGYLDANLSVEYRYTKRISAWLRMSNMLAPKYQQWNFYRTQRFQAMLGASYAF